MTTKKLNYKLKKYKCTVCDVKFIHNKPETLVGKLSIIPVNLCKKHFTFIMKKDHLPLNDSRKEA
mgnify:FL=1|jgi:hypothetical protein